MTKDLRDFTARVINSPLKLELVTYFHRNRFTMDYAEGTAQRIGADPRKVERALVELAAEGVVNQHQSIYNSSRPPVFSYTRNDSICRLIEELTHQLQTEEGRSAILALLSPPQGP